MRVRVAVCDDAAEATAVKAFLQVLFLAPSRYYVGEVQDPAATTPAAGWVAFTGGASPATRPMAARPATTSSSP